MRVAIMQPYVFPYLGYYQLMNAVDKFVIYDDVNYINRGWINRNNILLNGKAFLIGIPLRDASQNRTINQTEISTDKGWQNKFIKTIEQAYKKAPYFDRIMSLVIDVILSESLFISQLALKSLKTVSEYLGIKNELVDTSEKYHNRDLKGQDRILDICKKEIATHYINPIGGVDIYSTEPFEKEQIHFNFLKTRAVSYNQFNNEFIPNLSIIDVLMFNSIENIRDLLNAYDLV